MKITLVFEVIALISTISCVVLSAREHVLAWFMGIISTVSLIVVYYITGLYAQILLQVLFFIQCIIGWINWNKKDEVRINRINSSDFFILIPIVLTLGLVYSIILNLIVDIKNPLLTCIDGVSVMVALVGNYLLTKKVLQSWLLFMAYNVLIAFLSVIEGVYLISVLNSVLFFISLTGYNKWKRSIKMV